MSSPDEVRAVAGAGAVEMLDLMDDEVIEALEDFTPHLQALVEHMCHWPSTQRLIFLLGLVAAAAEEI